MAGFCSKCGSPLPSNTGFCPACGTPVPLAGEPVASVPVPQAYVPVQTPVAYSQPAYTQPAAGTYAPPANYATPPPAKSSALKIILIVIAVFVGLGILGAAFTAYTYYRIARSFHVNKSGDGVSISTPGGGSFSAGGNSDLSASDLGVPLYPGATHKQNGGLQMKSAHGSMMMGAYTTGDSPEAVLTFYRDKLGANSIETKTATNGATVLQSGGDAKQKIMITIGPATGDDEGKTNIVIMNRSF